MISDQLDIQYTGYRIKLIIAIEKNGSKTYNNELLVPMIYATLQDAERHIQNDIKKRLTESMYFRSQKIGYDLVLYADTATSNTYLAYRIVPVKLSGQESARSTVRKHD